MPTKRKIIKTFYTDITLCKDFISEQRTLCLFSCDGKFGLAEKHESGRLSVLIDCEYDYIDTFCAENEFTNMVAVLCGEKWGLFAFRWTVSTKSNKISCEKIVPCEYRSVKTFFGNTFAILTKSQNTVRYYNVLNRRLSDFYMDYISAEDASLFCFYINGIQKWIDVYSDNVIYECDEADVISFEKIWQSLFVLYHYECDNVSVRQCRTDLIFYNPDLLTSYLAEDVRYLRITTHDFDKWTANRVVTFMKDEDWHIVSTADSKWDFDEIAKFAKESNGDFRITIKKT